MNDYHDVAREYAREFEVMLTSFVLTSPGMPEDEVKKTLTVIAKRFVEWADAFPTLPTPMGIWLLLELKKDEERAAKVEAELRTFKSLFGKTNQP